MKSMKKLFALLCAVACVCVCLTTSSTCVTAYATDRTPDTDYKNTEAYAFVSEFISACPDRGSVENQRYAASWLKTKFEELLPTDPNVSVAVTDASNDDFSTVNVVVKLKSSVSDGKQIVVGAHYDAVSNSQGAGDNASGIAAMYLTLKSVSSAWTSSKLPYDLVFLAFGGEEQGLVGSYSYVSAMNDKQLSETLLMINIDSIGFGDNLYLHCENKRTDIADYILSKCSAAQEKPYNKGIFISAVFADQFGYGYYETIQGSDHTPFRTAGVPTAFFFSGNYYGNDFVESLDDKRCVMNTANDSLASVDSYVGAGYVANIQSVAEAVTSCIAADDFLPVCQNARSQLVDLSVAYGVLYPSLVALGLAIVCAVLFWLYYRKLQKRAVMGTAEIKTTRVFTQPDADDIFTLDK